jgi:glycogen operon protein
VSGDQAQATRLIAEARASDSLVVRDYFGNPISDDTFLLFFNAHHEDFTICLPGAEEVKWRRIIDTALEEGFVSESPLLDGGKEYTMTMRSFCLFEQVSGSDEQARAVHSRSANEKKAGPRKSA